MKKPNYFDAVHAAPYEQYVEEIVLRGLGDVALGSNPLSSVFKIENLPQHDKNDSVYEAVREWNELNEAIEEFDELFNGSPITLPLISDFEKSGAADFLRLKEKYEYMQDTDLQPLILFTPYYCRNNVNFFKELAQDNGISIKDPYNFLGSINELDYAHFWHNRRPAQRAVFGEVKSSSYYWTVAIICGSPNNILHPPGLKYGGFDSSNKALWHEYILAQILLARRGSTLLDTKKATYGNQTKPHNVLQGDDMAMYFLCFNPNNQSIEITKIRREKVANGTANLRIKIILTAPGSGNAP